MGFVQFTEPAGNLTEAARTFARVIVSMGEEAEAINLYEQRMVAESNSEGRAIMANSQAEEMKHFGMDLEFLLRQKPKWRAILKAILFTDGDIVDHGEDAEHAAHGVQD